MTSPVNIDTTPGQTAQKCWLNPTSSASRLAYRPDFAVRLNGNSAASSNGGPSAPPVRARPAPTVPTDVLTKAFSVFLTKRFGGSAMACKYRAGRPSTVCSFSVVAGFRSQIKKTKKLLMGDNAEDAIWETVQTVIWAGTARPTAMVDAKVPHLGRRSDMVMPESKINMASGLDNRISGAMEVPAKCRSHGLERFLRSHVSGVLHDPWWGGTHRPSDSSGVGNTVTTCGSTLPGSPPE